MAPDGNSRLASKWPVMLMAIGLALVVGALWWISRPGDRPEPPREAVSDREPLQRPTPDEPAENYAVLQRSALAPVACKNIPEPQAVVKVEKAPVALRRPGRMIREDMFPVGNVTGSLPAPAPVFRPSREVFGAFGYAGRLWRFTGRCVFAGHVDLVPTGYQLTGRKLFALANTAAPETVLFVESANTPDKYAVYR